MAAALRSPPQWTLYSRDSDSRELRIGVDRGDADTTCLANGQPIDVASAHLKRADVDLSSEHWIPQGTWGLAPAF
jgi:hypothetical protein